MDGSRIRENYKERVQAFDRRAELEGECAGVEPKETLRKTLLSPEQLSDAEAAFLKFPGTSIASTMSHYRQLESRAQARGAS